MLKYAQLASSCTSQLVAPLVRTKVTIPSEKQYPFLEIERKWQAQWKAQRHARIAAASSQSELAHNTSASTQTETNKGEAKSKPDYYCLSMFPYPSGNLHMGHVRVYTISDCLARFHKFKGYNVIHPMGWDAFGLPAENAAIQRGIPPKEWTMKNIKHMRGQLDSLGLDFDWEREVTTCDPEYYKWTQWIFLQLYRRGFAYQKEAEVNWDPIDQTVLANEQVDAQGRSWRSGAIVERRALKQWFFAITKYAEELNSALDSLSEGWPALVRTMQRVWIGRKHSAHVDFLLNGSSGMSKLTAFTTRPDTLFGVKYVALAYDHPFVAWLRSGEAHKSGMLPADKMAQDQSALREFLQGAAERHALRKTKAEKEASIPANAAAAALQQKKIEDVPTEGYFTGIYVQHPLLADVRVPLYIADYVEPGRGTGVVMGVPAHDISDYAFAKRHGLDIQPVLRSTDNSSNAQKSQELPLTTTSGVVLTNTPAPYTAQFDGMPVQEAQVEIVKLLESKGLGQPKPTFALHDWLVSRQRYWGTPIPIIHCAECGTVPVPEEDLPVTLPENVELTGKGLSPLASDSEAAKAWRECKCPKCGGPAQRETDTLDTFIDSSWYFLRYLSSPKHRAAEKIVSPSAQLSTSAPTLPWDPEEVKRFFPVTQYIGGVEHAILHLLYSRFITRFLADDRALKINSPEPFAALLTQGMVHGEAFKHPVSKRYYKPEEVDVEVDSTTGERVAYLKPTMPDALDSNGHRVRLEVVWEKMSKSKSNGVEPDAMIVKFGADVCRLFILFKAPPEKVLDWDERTVQGNFRWINRLWAIGRAYNAAYEEIVAQDTSNLEEAFVEDPSMQWHQRSIVERPKSEVQASLSGVEIELLQAAAEAIESFTKNLQTHNFNVAIAGLMKFSNQLEEYLEKVQVPSTDPSSGGAPDWVYSKSKLRSTAFREALEILVRLLAPITPHFASEFWSVIRAHNGKQTPRDIHTQTWLVTHPSWLSVKVAPIIIQQNGKLKQCVEVPFDVLSTALSAFPDNINAAQNRLKELLMDHELVAPHITLKMREAATIICRLTKNNTSALLNFVVKK